MTYRFLPSSKTDLQWVYTFKTIEEQLVAYLNLNFNNN